MSDDKKKDDGIVTLHNGVQISEETRDALLKRDWSSAPSVPYGFNPNTATTRELEEHMFSGYRVNNFTGDIELWVVGHIRVRRRLQDSTPKTLADMHEEAFQTKGSLVEVDLPAQRITSSKRVH